MHVCVSCVWCLLRCVEVVEFGMQDCGDVCGPCCLLLWMVSMI